MLNIKRLILALTAIISITTAWAQQGAQILSDELTYNFGTIAEADGFASHTFTIKNTGDAPLVITRVTASCGCTRPEWTKSPICLLYTSRPGIKRRYLVLQIPERRIREFLHQSSAGRCVRLGISGLRIP